MSERKINLEEILLVEMDKFRLSFPDENLYSTEQIKESLELPYFKAAMKEACRQVLEFAAENAQLVGEAIHNNRLPKDYVCGITQFNDQTDDFYYKVDKESITNTINQVE